MGAHPDPATLFETIVMPNEMEGRSAPENIKDVLMDQGILLAEETFDSSLTKSTALQESSASSEQRKKQDSACSKMDRLLLELPLTHYSVPVQDEGILHQRYQEY